MRQEAGSQVQHQAVLLAISGMESIAPKGQKDCQVPLTELHNVDVTSFDKVNQVPQQLSPDRLALLVDALVPPTAAAAAAAQHTAAAISAVCSVTRLKLIVFKPTGDDVT